MSVSQGSSCTIGDCEMSLKTVCLEKEYENILGHTAHLLDAEKIRVQCLGQLLLRSENDELRLQLDQANEELIKATKAESDALIQLNGARNEIKNLQDIIQISSQEIEGLHKEITSLNNNMIEYKGIFAEKIRLSEDLSSAQSELERLRAQSSSCQASFTEKHDLERQLRSVEAQLEKEKYAHERTLAKVSQQMKEIANLSGQLEKARKELVEVQAREQQQRSTDQQGLKRDAERAALEAMVESLEKQLRSAKNQIQQTRHDLQRRRGNARVHELSDSRPQSHVIPLQQAAAPFIPDMTIATPGAVQVRGKATRFSALPGDKSAFSITPFLSRASAPPDSPVSSTNETDELDTVNTSGKLGTLSSSASAFEDKSMESSPQDETSSVDPRRNMEGQAPNPRGTMSIAAFKGRISSRGSGNVDSERRPVGSNALQIQSSSQGPSKTKRRKLGAQRDKSMFNDDDDGDLLEARKPGHKLAIPGGLHSATSAGDRLHQNWGFCGPTAFSPLKRDRRRLQ